VAAGAVSAGLGVLLAGIGGARWWPIALGAGAITVAGVATIVLSHVRRRDAFSPLGLTAIFYVASFAGGGIYFWIVRNPDTTQIPPVYDQRDIVIALVLAAVSFAMLACGYLINPLGGLLRLVPAPPRVEDGRQRIRILVILLAVGWLARLEQLATGAYFHVSESGAARTGSSWFIYAASQLPLLATAFVGAQAFLARRRGVRDVRGELLFYALLATEIGWYAPSGSRGALLTLLLMVAVVRYYGLGRRPSWIGVVAAAAIAVFVVFPLELQYRNTQGGYQYAPGANLAQSGQALLHQNGAQTFNSGFRATVTRFSSITSVAAIQHSGTHVLDRKPGETLVWSAQTLLPRALDEDKPDPGVFGNEFGRAYGILVPSNDKTSIAVTQFGEMQLSFGLTGIVVGMLLVGAIYRLIGDYFGGRTSDPVALAVYAVSAWNVINLQEAILAVGLFGLIKLMVFLLLALAVANRVQQLRVRPA
jgi:hypothetical protein